jgi:type IV secretion system protein VirB2
MTLQQRNSHNTRWILLAILTLTFVPAVAMAAGSGMPWEGWLDKVLTSITGPVAKAVGVIAIVGCGLGMAFSDGGSTMRKFMMACLGLSIAFTASSFFLGFLGYGGGAVIG